jgi:hypothetical protein
MSSNGKGFGEEHVVSYISGTSMMPNNARQQLQIGKVEAAFREAARIAIEHMAPGRHAAMAMAALESAFDCAVKAIAENDRPMNTEAPKS